MTLLIVPFCHRIGKSCYFAKTDHLAWDNGYSIVHFYFEKVVRG